MFMFELNSAIIEHNSKISFIRCKYTNRKSYKVQQTTHLYMLYIKC